MNFPPQAYIRALCAALVTLFVLALVGPPLFEFMSTILSAENNMLWSARAETFSSARLEIVGDIVLRAATTATVSLILALPLGIFLGQAERPFYFLLASSLLLAPFFVSDSVKSYAWADMLVAIRSSGNEWMAASLSPYSPLSPWIPLILKTVPIFALTVALAYRWVVVPQLRAIREFSAGTFYALRTVTLPLLAPYLVSSWVLAFGFVIPATAELQYLGGVMQNTLTTLMLSLLRSGVDQTELFSVCLFVVAVVATLLMLGVLRRRASSTERTVYRLLRIATYDSSSRKIGKTGLTALGKRAMLLYAIVVIVVGCLPLLDTVRLSFVGCGAKISCFGAPVGQALWSSDRLLRDVTTSLFLGLACAAGGWIACLAGIWSTALRPMSWSIAFAVLMALLLPPDVVAIAYGQIGMRVGIDHGSLMLVLTTHLLMVFPYCFVLGCLAGLTQQRSGILALFELGLGAGSITSQAILRDAATTLTSAMVLAFVLSINDVIRIFYLGGPLEGLGGFLSSQLDAGAVEGTGVFIVSSAMVALGVIATLVLGASAARYSRQLLRYHL